MGDEKSVSSLHKDHYENLYAVIRGTKSFLLFPPTDRPFLKHEKYHTCIFSPIPDSMNSLKNRKFGLKSISSSPTTPWISVNPENPDFIKYPEFKNVC